ncbi:N-acetyltransferase [Pistricoccus aurantiacus]|uniref:N-acetyltransferase n=2 Tax=Pistricoccus aurantiacus TaxID=1883414 RepID=A0A5B8ST66_9GAMM|nr:N-acetyltransferase [Pistricoccus aurantiacus]
MVMTEESVRHNTAKSRYELEVDGMLAIATYWREGNIMTFDHTFVPPALEGRGIGSRLVAGALDDVRRQGRKFVPTCSFVVAYAKRHPETQDLLAV